MKTNGGAALIKALELEGVDVIFGLPGGAILPVYDPIIDSPIRHILVRHEQGAGHMAEGHEWSCSDQHHHAACRRVHGLGPHGCHHRAGRYCRHWH